MCGYICQLILLCVWYQTWDCQSVRCYQHRGIQRGLKWPLIPEIGMILVCVSPLGPPWGQDNNWVLGWNKNCDVQHFLLQSHILFHGVLRNNFQKLPSFSRFSEWAQLLPVRHGGIMSKCNRHTKCPVEADVLTDLTVRLQCQVWVWCVCSYREAFLISYVRCGADHQLSSLPYIEWSLLCPAGTFNSRA